MGQQSGVVEREIELRGSDGAAVPAFVAEPSGAKGAPRIVIAPEIFGLSPWVKSAARRLAPGGALIVEAGQGQSGEIQGLMTAAGLTLEWPAKTDLAGIRRAVAGRKAPS